MPTINEYKYQQSIGADINKFLEELKFKSRDNARTPFQWDASNHAGFTKGASTWIAVNENYKSINAAAQEKDKNSCLQYFRK
ncbi:glucohydrolase, partial [Acinetobacter baumannii]